MPVLAPLLVSLLGVGGSIWAARLEPYAPYLLALSGVLVGYGFWAVYRPRRPAVCANGAGEGCDNAAARPPRRPLALQAFLWSAGAVWLFALGLQVLRLIGLSFR